MISAPFLVSEFPQITFAKFFSSNVLPINIPRPSPDNSFFVDLILNKVLQFY